MLLVADLLDQRQRLPVVCLGAVIVVTLSRNLSKVVENTRLRSLVGQVAVGRQCLGEVSLGLGQLATLLCDHAAHSSGSSLVTAITTALHRLSHVIGPCCCAVGLAATVVDEGHVIGSPARLLP